MFIGINAIEISKKLIPKPRNQVNKLKSLMHFKNSSKLFVIGYSIF